MEFEALLLGTEPLALIALAAGAVILVPVVGAVGAAIGQENLAEPLVETARENTKKAIIAVFSRVRYSNNSS
jgi:hypothetical protein